MAFENVEFTYPNISFGPTPGRVYNFDHENDNLVVKTYPGGTLIDIAPADSPIGNEVISADFDGYYFWALSTVGSTGTLGMKIQKWFYDGNTLQKQIGIGNEIPLIDSPSFIYDSEAMSVQTYTTVLGATATSGSSSAIFDSTTFLSIGDHVYLGPSNYQAGEFEEKVVQSVVGTTVTFTQPLQNSFLVNDQVKYLKDIWLYNNASGRNTTTGSLLRVSTKTGNVVGIRSGLEFKHVVAAGTKSNGNLVYIRGTQFFEYKAFGTNSGYQTSLMLVNVKPNKQDIVKVYDLVVDSTSVLKLQKELVYFDSGSGDYLTTTWDEYNVDREFFANRVFSITHTRNRSVLFAQGVDATFTVKVRDQYDIPVVGRQINVIDNDPSGSIPSGYESFVTDVQGEGLSKYRTGPGLQHALPEITVTEFITKINSKTSYVQTPDTDNEGFVQQIEDTTTNEMPITQITFTGSFPLVQIKELDSFSYLHQYADLESESQVYQRIQEDLTYVQQTDEISDKRQLVQTDRISEIVEVQQYEFLVFAIPEPFSIKNPVDTNITVRIVGFGALALVPATLVFRVNGEDVTSDVELTAFPGGLEIFYNPPVDFPYLSTVTVDIFIQDSDVPPNLISTTYTFETVADFKAPVVTEVFPLDYSVNNSELTDVYALLRDNETGIDVSTIEMFVNGLKVTPSIEEISPGLYKVLHQTTTPYMFESTVSAAVRVRDLAGNELIEPWNFGIISSAGIFYTNANPEDCNVLVPIDSSICIEAFGKEQGIHIDTAIFELEGTDVVFALVPKVYRKE